ncbi:MAG: ABC-type Fe3+-hydroxamate transport system substrate-binding protein [Bacteroidia bacterium]|jgi:ABC-type Fe3+-hydroxamate transport system substrate-binding protein
MRFIDQMNHTLAFNTTPKRIISLVPSQTELLYYLGVTPIAQTVFCIHPKDQFQSANKIGGTKKLQLDKIRALQPDLIIGNKEENVVDQINVLRNEFPVWMSDVNTLDDAYKMIQSVGDIIDESHQSEILNTKIEQAFNRLFAPKSTKPKVLYLIWQDPFFGIGANTFIHEIMETAGFNNVLQNQERYPELTVQDIHDLDPEYIFLSSEPFPFKQSHCDTLSLLFTKSKIMLVDGELFSWYGNRLLDTPLYIEGLISDIRSYESQS